MSAALPIRVNVEPGKTAVYIRGENSSGPGSNLCKIAGHGLPILMALCISVCDAL